MPASLRACDACNLRRTKCSGSNPCAQCTKSCLACTFDRPTMKKGPAGKTLTRLRQRSSPVQKRNDELVWRDSSAGSSSQAEAGPSRNQYQPDPVLHLPAAGPLDSAHSLSNLLVLLDNTIQSSLEQYFVHLHHLSPIVDDEDVRSRLGHKEHLSNPQFASLILALAARGLMLPTSKSGSMARAEMLLEHSLNLHQSLDLGLRPTLDCLSTSNLLASGLHILKGYGASHLRHRETLALAELMNLGHPSGYTAFSYKEKEMAFRIYCILLASEKSNSLLLLRPSSIRLSLSQLSPLLDSNSFHTDLTERIQPCTRLFDAITPEVIDCINNQCNLANCNLDRLTISRTYKALESASHLKPILSQTQLADVLLTREWLEIKLWQSCVSHGLLLPTANESCFTISYPLEKLERCREIQERMIVESISGNGQAMGHKLRVVLDAVEAVLSLPIPPIESADDVRGAIEQLRGLVNLCASQKWMRWEVEAAR